MFKHIILFENYKNMKFDIYTIDGFLKFCKEREKIRDKKNSGEPRPWTKDEILHKKKFCNIDRKDDRMTKEFLKVIKNKSDNLKILGALFFRITLSGTEIPSYLDKFDSCNDLIKDYTCDSCELVKYNKGKINPYQFVAYKKGMNIRRYIIDYLIKNHKSILKEFKIFDKISLKEATMRLCPQIGYKRNLKFITFQAAADLSYLFPKKILENSEPYYGPGSISALKEMTKNDKKTKDEILKNIQNKTGWTLLKIEHGLCEYDKYCKFKLGTKSFNSKSNDYKER